MRQLRSDLTPSEVPRESPAADPVAGALISLIHTCRLVTDLDRSLAFYAALGFSETFRFSLPGDGCDGVDGVRVFMNLPMDGTEPRLELAYWPGLGSDELGSCSGHIAVTTADMDATLTALARHGIEPEEPPRALRAGGNRICFIRDPDGHRLELIERLVNWPAHSL